MLRLAALPDSGMEVRVWVAPDDVSKKVTEPVAGLAISVAVTKPVPYNATDGATISRTPEAVAPRPARVWMTAAESI